MKTLLTILFCLFILTSCDNKPMKAQMELNHSFVSTDSTLACEVMRLTKENIELQKQISKLANNQALIADNISQIVIWIDRNSR